MTSDSDEEGLKKAIALSLLETTSSPSAQLPTDTTTCTASTLVSRTVACSSNKLDLKGLHDARQARLSSGKRQRPISPPPLSRKAPKLPSPLIKSPKAAIIDHLSTAVQSDPRSRKLDATNTASSGIKRDSGSSIGSQSDGLSPHLAGITYPTGVIKKTWAFGHPRDPNDIKLEEVLEPASLLVAVISSFQWDMDWLLAKLKTPLNGGTTKCVFVMEAKTPSMRMQLEQETGPARAWLRLCFPPMEGVSCMHSKIMCLFHSQKLRIVLPTANMLKVDWGELGTMENSAFMIDLPRRRGDSHGQSSTFFYSELLHFVKSQAWDQDIISALSNFDFTPTKNIAFVHTTGGSNLGDGGERTGLSGLARAVRRLGLETDENTRVDFVTSSCGALRDEYLNSLHASARGLDVTKRSAMEASNAKVGFFKKHASETSSNRPTSPADIANLVRVYFPTYETVRASSAGSIGQICIERKYYEHPHFPRAVLRDYVSKREGLLSHNKLLYVRGRVTKTGVRPALPAEEHDADIAWVYVGSANVSQSAWGNKPIFDKVKSAWKVYCRNWESGVLVPVRRNRQYIPDSGVNPGRALGRKDGQECHEEAKAEGIVGLDVFDGTLPMPCQYPGAQYNGRHPWYFKEGVR